MHHSESFLKMYSFAMLRSTGQKLYEIYNWAPADFCLRIYYRTLLLRYCILSHSVREIRVREESKTSKS